MYANTMVSPEMYQDTNTTLNDQTNTRSLFTSYYLVWPQLALKHLSLGNISHTLPSQCHMVINHDNIKERESAPV